MKKFKNLILKYGSFIAACAFLFVTISANTACIGPYYEPKEPANMRKFKKLTGKSNSAFQWRNPVCKCTLKYQKCICTTKKQRLHKLLNYIGNKQITIINAKRGDKMKKYLTIFGIASVICCIAMLSSLNVCAEETNYMPDTMLPNMDLTTSISTDKVNNKETDFDDSYKDELTSYIEQEITNDAETDGFTIDETPLESNDVSQGFMPTSELTEKQKENTQEIVLNTVELRLRGYTKLKKPEEFKSIIDCSSRAAYGNVSDYTAFVCEYNLTDAQLEVINRILDKGTTIQSLIQVYKFWLTTDYDFTMVEEICALEDSYFSEYWYESAFNAITGNIHGVLSAEDINYYRNLGITTDQILAANVLCRKEGQNIFDILDGVCAGITINQQAMEIYNVDALPEAVSTFKSVTELAESVALAIPATTDAMVFSRALSKEETLRVNYEVVSEKVTTELERLNIPEPEETLEDDYHTLNSIYLPVSIKRALLNKGYTPEEIQKVAMSHETNLNKAARNAREAVKNEKQCKVFYRCNTVFVYSWYGCLWRIYK